MSKKVPRIRLKEDNGAHIVIEAIDGTTMWNGGAFAKIFYFKKRKPTSDKKNADVSIYVEYDKEGNEIASRRTYLRPTPHI